MYSLSVAEDPKQFLKEVKSGIGESVWQDGRERIHFYDAMEHACKVERNGMAVELWTEGGSIHLSKGQAQRLCNTLERWIHMGNFGKPDELPDGDG